MKPAAFCGGIISNNRRLGMRSQPPFCIPVGAVFNETRQNGLLESYTT